MSDFILDKLKQVAETNGFEITGNAEKIARLKGRMFGDDEWYRCPCDGFNEERFCCSQLCQSDVRAKGLCHCGLFKRVD